MEASGQTMRVGLTSFLRWRMREGSDSLHLYQMTDPSKRQYAAIIELPSARRFAQTGLTIPTRELTQRMKNVTLLSTIVDLLFRLLLFRFPKQFSQAERRANPRKNTSRNISIVTNMRGIIRPIQNLILFT
jgi:hypothetical protein